MWRHAHGRTFYRIHTPEATPSGKGTAATRPAPLLETLVFNEIRACLACGHLLYRLHYWRSHEGVEVDFPCEASSGFVAIEAKAAREWQGGFSRGLRRIREEPAPAKVRLYGICLCERRVRLLAIDARAASYFRAASSSS